VSIIGYTSFAESIGAGGLIAEAFVELLHNNMTMVWSLVLCIVIIVQIFQEGGLLISKKIDKRRK
jgi:D-methionine transport system permease protein